MTLKPAERDLPNLKRALSAAIGEWSFAGDPQIIILQPHVDVLAPDAGDSCDNPKHFVGFVRLGEARR
jgi:hypothetical protein